MNPKVTKKKNNLYSDMIAFLTKGITWDKQINLEDNMAYAMDFCYVLWKLKQSSYCSGTKFFKACNSNNQEVMLMSLEELLYFLDDTNQWESVVKKAAIADIEDLERFILEQTIEPYYESEQVMLDCLVYDLLEISSEDLVGILRSRGNEFALYCNDNEESIRCDAYDEAYVYRNLGMYRSEVKNTKSIRILDEIDEEVKYSKIFVNNDLTVEMDRRSVFCREFLRTWPEFPSDITTPWDWCGVALKVLKEDGKAVALMDPGQLSSRVSQKVRRYLIDNNLIEGVIALPEKLYTNVWQNTYLLILGKNTGDIRMYDARLYYEKGRDNARKRNTLTVRYIKQIADEYVNGKNCIHVSKEFLAQNDYILMPQRYEIVEEKKHVISFDRLIKTTSRGISLSGSQIDQYVSDIPKGEKCIQPSCISNGLLTNVQYFDVANFKGKLNFAHKGDLLINKVGRPMKVAVADDTYIVVGNIYIITIQNDIYNAYFIKCFLESKTGQQEMEKYTAGSGTNMISIENIRKLDIPYYHASEQSEYLTKCREMVEKMQQLVWDMQQIEDGMKWR